MSSPRRSQPPPPMFLPRLPSPAAASTTYRATAAAATAVTMVRGPSAASSSSSSAFPTPESLSAWLRPRLPHSLLSSWGVSPGTKSLHNLWLEISLGETSFIHDSPPVRTVHVATVRVLNRAGAVLVESHQLMSDGSLRPRGRPLSEKMRPGEPLDDAVARAVREELGGRTARIIPGSHNTSIEDRPSSVSYPGLPARYVLHSVDAEVDGLPEEGEFETGELGEDFDKDEKVVVVKKHFWKWVLVGDESTATKTN